MINIINPSLRPAFLADKNGTNQTNVSSITNTAVTFGTERYDIGSFFGSDVWTPPAGKVFLYCSLVVTGTIAANAVSAPGFTKTSGGASGTGYILKAATSNNYTFYISEEDLTDGTVSYGINLYATCSSGKMTISGVTSSTYFGGYWFAA